MCGWPQKPANHHKETQIYIQANKGWLRVMFEKALGDT